MIKKVWVNYEYIINCCDLVEIEIEDDDEDFDIDDEACYDYIDLPDNKIEITINGETWDCDFVGISCVSDADD